MLAQLTRNAAVLIGALWFNTGAAVYQGEATADVEPMERGTFMVCGTPFDLEIARTREQQQLGLGLREKLEDGTGMLFVYKEDQWLSFWMKNMKFPLEIAFFEGDGRFLNHHFAPAPEPGTPDIDLPEYNSQGPARFAVEINPEFFSTQTGLNECTLSPLPGR